MAIRGEAGCKIISDDWATFNKHFGGALELETMGERTLEIMKTIAPRRLLRQRR